MLFNDYLFIFIFMPITLAGFFLIGRRFPRPALLWLTLASLVFYAWWKPIYLALLVPSILFNFAMGKLIAHQPSVSVRRLLLFFGVGLNLLLLGYFKYAGFFVDTVNILFGQSIAIGNILLPLAISFFTFTQIAYLVDSYEQNTRDYDLLSYALFVTFFPHLIAGPIVHHWQLIPQFFKDKFRFSLHDFSIGLSIFLVGLIKKVLVADTFATLANPMFSSVAGGAAPGLGNAWVGILAYTLQIYYDFSGYSDMAIGLARMFGWVFPVNFNSPYKANSIIDFWRRWHITLSRFLQQYLYISLGGNRKGKVRRFVNLMVTMLLGGLWHGAGWTFVMWGGLHGLFLIINHGWRDLTTRLPLLGMPFQGMFGHFLGRSLTFLAVVIGWVFFRAQSFPSALHILHSMAGLDGLGMPAMSTMYKVMLIPLFLLAVFFLPNTQELFVITKPVLEEVKYRGRLRLTRPQLAFGVALGILFFFVIRTYFAAAPSPFLYFNF